MNHIEGGDSAATASAGPPAHGLAARNVPPVHCLLAFEALARNRNLHKAAGELGVTTSAIGQSIGLLEDRLGLKLVSRLTPAVELTAAGQDYRVVVQRFTQGIRDDLYRCAGAVRTLLRVSAPQALCRLWLAPRLADFIRQHPRIDLVVDTTAQFQPLVHGGVDIALRYAPGEGGDVVTVPLWTDRLIAVGSPAWADRAEPFAVASFPARLPLIDHPSAHWPDWIAHVTGGEPPVCRPLLSCNDLDLVVRAAVQGMGLALVPQSLVGGLLADGRLKRVGTGSAPAKPYVCIASRDKAVRPPVIDFMQWIAAQVRRAGSGR